MVGEGVHDALELFFVACVFAGASAGAGVPIIVPTELVVCVVESSESVGTVSEGSPSVTPSVASWRAARPSAWAAPASTASFHLRMRWCVPKTWRFAGAEKIVECPCGAPAVLRRRRSLSSSSSPVSV